MDHLIELIGMMVHINIRTGYRTIESHDTKQLTVALK